MQAKGISQHITNSYRRYMDYAEYHARKAGIPDEAGDILNEVLLSLMGKNEEKLIGLLSKKKGGYSELDFYVLRMIKLNTYSKTAPYIRKTRRLPIDKNIDTDDEVQPPELPEPDEEIIDKVKKAREILESLNISKKDKDIFEWKFFKHQTLQSWPGDDNYQNVCRTYNRVKRQMISRIKNPHNGRKKWTAREISYLKAEYPNMETMTIAHYLKRNYNSVCRKAEQLGLKKNHFTKRKINRRCGDGSFCIPVMKGESP